ncbi:MAG TPA: DUF885 domain-containing protein [Verrucomicrobiae bacterium]|nr:DUF885 domain-containing protein [Verrucomicrobiae bacterium]
MEHTTPHEPHEHKTEAQLSHILDKLHRHEHDHNPLTRAVEGTGDAHELPNQLNYHYPFPLDAEKQAALQDGYVEALTLLKATQGVPTEETALLKERLERNTQIRLDLLRYNTDNFRPLDHTDESTPFLTFTDITGAGYFRYETPEDFEKGMLRAAGWAHWVDAAISTMEEGAQKGETTPSAVAIATHDHLAMIKNGMFEGFLAPLQQAEAIPTSLQKQYEQAMRNAAQNYEKLSQYVSERYIPAARSDERPGLKYLDTGLEQYQRILRYWTSEQLHPETLFRYAQEQYQKHEAELTALSAELGFRGAAALIAAIQKNHQFHSFSSAAEMHGAYTTITDIAMEQLPRLFKTLPQQYPEIRLTKALPGANIAKYVMPSRDGQRAGGIHVAVDDPTTYPAARILGLALHEGVPGHHLQLSLQSENSKHPYLQASVRHPAYRESWAQYAESLVHELGIPVHPYEHAAMIATKLLIARGVMLDVGLHYYGWSIAEAKQKKLAMHGNDDRQTHYEILRYLAWPGQISAYLFDGVFRELRHHAETELGSQFDVREFHDAVLQHGEMPLDLLPAHLHAWTNKQKTH